MNLESKVTSSHLQRAAYLYIRQSTLRQVLENTESTERQYALRRRAIALGWTEEQIFVIDHDQGQSGASTVEREGFQRLVADVGLGKAGIVMGLEVSRLARNCADWHRLLEICGLTDTLILDDEGLYHPAHFNDRLLLGLKGTMSEAELYVLKARLVGGLHNKAQRGELKIALPVGLVYDDEQRVGLDPDQQVRKTLGYFFETFTRVGSAWGTVQAFRREGLKFPRRGQAGTGPIVWNPLDHGTALETLHNPRYAGAFCFGRTRVSTNAEGKLRIVRLPREQWRFVKLDAHPGYITWDEYLANEQRLLENLHARREDRPAAGPPREGPALLQGLVLCGKCGKRMSVRYHWRDARLVPDYVCAEDCVRRTLPLCQSIPGRGLDEAIGRLLVQSVNPLALEVVLNVQGELQSRLEQADRLRYQHVQRAQYEADRARTRYMRVDPNNRLVADTLEAQWNEKLRLLAQATEEYQNRRQSDEAQLSAEQKSRIMALASDFTRLWNDPGTLDRDRKRMARLLLEDVTLRREKEVLAQVRFKGGATRELRLPLPQRRWELRQAKPEIRAEIDRLLADHTDAEVAKDLNRRDLRTSVGNRFTKQIVRQIRRGYRLRSYAERLQSNKGLLPTRQLAELLGITGYQVNYWRKQGLLQGVPVNDKNDQLYQRPSPEIIEQIKQRMTTDRPHPTKNERGAV